MGSRLLSTIIVFSLAGCGSGKNESTPDTWTDPVLDADPDSVGDECEVGTGGLALHPNIETVGVTVQGAGLPSAAQLFWREQGGSVWSEGHALMAIDDGRLAGSLFWLSESTSYEVRVVGAGIDACAVVTTQPDELEYSPVGTIYVDGSATAGGDGTESSPFATIQEAVDGAGAGDRIQVADGLYPEQVEVDVSGAAGAWIQIVAEGDGAIVDGSEAFSGDIWTPHGSVADVYSAEVGGSCWYLARDGQRVYRFNDLDGLLDGLGDDDVPMDEGFFIEDDTSTLWVRSLDDPSSSTWNVARHDRGFALDGVEWIWIEGFEIRYFGQGRYGRGIDIRNSSHVVVRNNEVHHLPGGVVVRTTDESMRADDARIEYNEIHDSPVDAWPWDAVKGTSMEGSAIVIGGSAGAIVRGNVIHNIFNGVYTGRWGDLENPDIAFDADVYRNETYLIGDDGFEPEGACINHRFWSNTFDNGHSGISLAPITHGPLWVVRNVFSDYGGTGFKWSNDSDAPVLVYHNTSYTDREEMNGMGFSGPFFNTIFRNNIVVGNRYAFESTLTGLTGHDWDNDNWYTSRTDGPHFKWEDVRYDTMADLCAATSMECSGHEQSPGFVDPSGGIFSLDGASPNVDAGIPIPGINDDHLGSGPDIGAVESH